MFHLSYSETCVSQSVVRQQNKTDMEREVRDEGRITNENISRKEFRYKCL